MSLDIREISQEEVTDALALVRSVFQEYVAQDYTKEGIGKELFQTVRERCHSDRMTVNSSPYSVPVYQRLGFHETDMEQVVNGLRFTPMEIQV